MEFAWPREAVEFRARLVDFLDREIPNWFYEGPQRARGDTMTVVPPAPRWPLVGENQQHDWSRGFAERLAEAGFLTPHWPREYGGEDASPWVQLALKEEMWLRGEPRGPQYMNVDWIGPTIMVYGSDQQKEQYLPRMARGEIVWCQGFSEPEAGTDLASLRTRAVRQGDRYVVTGQKIWTSYADIADHCFLAVRTDPDPGRRHRGLSVLLVDMTSPGIEVRPIPSVVGHTFNEVFLDEVSVPLDRRLGDEGDGWRVMLHGLSYERVEPRYARSMQYLRELAWTAEAEGLLPDADLERRFGEALEICEGARVLAYYVVAERAAGAPPSPVGNMARLLSAESERACAEVAIHILGGESLADGSVPDAAFRTSMSTPVAAGTEEVQLDLIAQNALGLPKNR